MISNDRSAVTTITTNSPSVTIVVDASRSEFACHAIVRWCRREKLVARQAPAAIIRRKRNDRPPRFVTFTKAQVRRAVKAAESAGLRVRRITINPDGAITIDAETEPVVVSKKPPSSWEDV